MTSHCGFDLHSLLINDVEHLFLHLMAICMSSLEKCLFHFLIDICLFFNQVVCFFAVELYELFIYLDINPLLLISFANIFSHSVGWVFVLLMVSLAVLKLLSLTSSHLFIFAFVCFRRQMKKILGVLLGSAPVEK